MTAATVRAPGRPSLLCRAAARTAALVGWRRAVLALVLGGTATLALPPLHLVPLLLPAFVGLVWLLDGCATRRGAFAVAWLFGFGHFVSGIYWIALALLTDPEKFAWMIPFAIFGISGVLAIFVGLAGWLMAASGARGWRRILVLAVAWTLALEETVDHFAGSLFRQGGRAADPERADSQHESCGGP